MLYYAIEILSQIETTPNKEKHKVESVNVEYESNNKSENRLSRLYHPCCILSVVEYHKIILTQNNSFCASAKCQYMYIFDGFEIRHAITSLQSTCNVENLLSFLERYICLMYNV